MADEQVLQVRIAVGLPGAVMAVLGAKRRELFEPLLDVRNQPVFGVVDVNPRRDVHRRGQRQAFLDLGLGQRLFELLGDIDKLPLLFGVEPEVFGMGFHLQRLPFILDFRFGYFGF